MKRKPHSTSLVLLLLCIFTFWWGISVLTQSSSTMPAPVIVANNTAPLSNDAPVLVHESVSGATHIYTGTYMPKNACDSFGSGIRYTSANGGHVTVLLITEPNGTQCAQAADLGGEPFTVSLKLSEGSKPTFDGVLLNGSTIPAQLVEGN